MLLPNSIESKLFSFELMKPSPFRLRSKTSASCSPEGKDVSSCKWATFSQSPGDSPFIFSLRRPDLIRGSAAQPSDKSYLRQHPDDPLGGIHLPWLDPIAIVILKLVVIVVITFAESEKGEEKRVTRAAFG